VNLQPKFEILAYLSSIFAPTSFVRSLTKISAERNRLTENVSAAARNTPEELLEKIKQEDEIERGERNEKSLLRVLGEEKVLPTGSLS